MKHVTLLSRVWFSITWSRIAGILGVAIVTALVIYMTPLKHLNLLSPAMHEMEPSDFYTEYLAHPEDYVFIDVRSPGIYASAHAKGAINIPIENLYEEHYSLPRTGKKIVLICTTGRLAAIAYGYLQNWGFLNLIHIQGGMQSWAVQGLPIVGTSALPTSLQNAAGDDHQ